MTHRLTTFLLPETCSSGLAAGPATRALVVRVDGSSEAMRSEHPFPVDVCVLVDCGWFMDESHVPRDTKGPASSSCSKLEAAKSALGVLVNAWPTTRTLSIVGFGDTATRHVTRLASGQEDVCRKAIHSLTGRAVSELAVGLREAASLLLAGDQKTLKKVLLLHGGQIRNAGAALQTAEELAVQGVSVDVIAIGDDASRPFAQRIAACGNGRSWLACTQSEAERAVSEFGRLISEIATTGASLSLALAEGWAIRGCVRYGNEHVPLFSAEGQSPQKLTLHVGGLSTVEPMDLWFHLQPDFSGEIQPLRGSVSITYDNVSERHVFSFEDTPTDARATALGSVIDSTAASCTALCLKLVERDLWLADQRSDRSSLETAMRTLHSVATGAKDDTLRQVAGRLKRQFDERGVIDRELFNALVNRSSALPVANPAPAESGRSMPPTRRGELAPSAAGDAVAPATLQTASMDHVDKDARSATPLPTHHPTQGSLDIAIDGLLTMCEASLETYERMEAVRRQGHASFLAVSTAAADTGSDTVRTWLQSAGPDGESCLDDTERCTRELRLAIAALRPLAERFRALARDRLLFSDTVTKAIACIEFYRWKDAGWMATLDSLRHRGNMLRAVLEES